MKARQAAALATQEEDNEGNALIQKLRKQSVDNKEKNDLIVRQKTLLNDQVSCYEFDGWFCWSVFVNTYHNIIMTHHVFIFMPI